MKMRLAGRLLTGLTICLLAANARCESASDCAVVPSAPDSSVKEISEPLGRFGRLVSCVYSSPGKNSAAVVEILADRPVLQGALLPVVDPRSGSEEASAYVSTKPFAVVGSNGAGIVWVIRSRSMHAGEIGSADSVKNVFLTSGQGTRHLFDLTDSSSGDAGENWDTVNGVTVNSSGRIDVSEVRRYSNRQDRPYYFAETRTRLGYWDGRSLVFGSTETKSGYFMTTADREKPAVLPLSGRLCRDAALHDCVDADKKLVLILSVTAKSDGWGSNEEIFKVAGVDDDKGIYYASGAESRLGSAGPSSGDKP